MQLCRLWVRVGLHGHIIGTHSRLRNQDNGIMVTYFIVVQDIIQ